MRQAVAEGRADFVPVFLSDIPRLFTSGQLPLDVALVHVIPPDAHGFCSLGTSVDTARAAVDSARLVIAQINPRMPRTLGDSFIHLDQIDFAVEVDAPLLAHAPEPIGATEHRIGGYVAELVEDGATLQLGIGGIPNAALAATARGGTISRIVPTLTAGAGVTTTRAHVQSIVAEFGVAYLHGKSIRERARAVIGIAHPAFRDELEVWARRERYRNRPVPDHKSRVCLDPGPLLPVERAGAGCPAAWRTAIEELAHDASVP